MNSIIDIGARRELFVDRYLIQNVQGGRLKLHYPVSQGVAIWYDTPWESADGHSESFYTTVLKDRDIYRMYYRGHAYLTCYAESRDGIDWTKPSFGLIDAGGTTENNAILTHKAHRGFCAFVDTKPGIPVSERYKANVEDTDGLIGYVSGDGVHWKKLQDEPIVPRTLPNHFDSQNVMFWSEIENCYLLYARYMTGSDRIRSTARATSADFIHWSDPVPMEYSDTGSTTPSAQLYTNQTHPYFRAPHIYISLPGRIFFERLVGSGDEAYFGANDGTPRTRKPGDCSDGVLLTTRAGTRTYDFTFKESFVRPGIGSANWTTRTNYPALGVVQTGPAEMSLYVNRHYEQRSAHLERLTLRLDGFASVNAPLRGGDVTTKPLTFAGKQLELNYSTSAAGSIRVELLGREGKPIEGYSVGECRALIGDEVERVVTWNGSSDLSSLAGKPLQVRFHMQDADLFSFRFAETASPVTPQ